MAPPEADGPPPSPDVVVLLAGPGDTTDIVANFLADRVPDLAVIVEGSPSRTRMARRRAARHGWTQVIGQVLFVVVALPVLRWRGRDRIGDIVRERGLDTSPHPVRAAVPSVNDPATVDLLAELHPTLVVVNGTRIIARSVLDAIDCPVVNTHAGITPRYRGVHGGYWALAEGRPDLVGTTVHLVDPGIDTGGVLGRAFFDVTTADTIATYPYLHLAAGLPVLADQVETVLSGAVLAPLAPPSDTGDLGEVSRLRLHPTLWGYLRTWLDRHVR